MNKKIYNKNKFVFLCEYNTKIENNYEPRYYYRHEFRFIRYFPFIKKEFIEYKFVAGYWIEQ